jgi:hypothetical protein
MTVLEAALGYAEQYGCSVFPCYEPARDERGVVTGDCTCPPTHPKRNPLTGACPDVGKHPRTARGPLAATRSATVIQGWWERWPNANPAVACKPSGLAALDVDPRHGGDDTLAALEREQGPLPATWRDLTGGGGVHIIYCAPVGVALVDGQGVLGPGIDLKANGYILVPPALHVSGRRYVPECGYEPASLPLAPLPSWVLERLRHRAGDRLRRDGTLLVIHEGERNRRLCQIAGLLRRYGLNERSIRECLRVINREHATPPLPDGDIAAIAKSVCRYPATVPDFSGGASHTHKVRVV